MYGGVFLPQEDKNENVIATLFCSSFVHTSQTLYPAILRGKVRIVG